MPAQFFFEQKQTTNNENQRVHIHNIPIVTTRLAIVPRFRRCSPQLTIRGE